MDNIGYSFCIHKPNLCICTHQSNSALYCLKQLILVMDGATPSRISGLAICRNISRPEMPKMRPKILAQVEWLLVISRLYTHTHTHTDGLQSLY